MANFKSKQVQARVPAVTCQDSVATMAIMGEYVTKAGDAIGDIIEMCAIPADCVVVDVVVETTALGASVTLDAGIMTGTYGEAGMRTVGNEFFAAKAASGASVIRRDKNVIGQPPQLFARSLGVKLLGAAPAAGQTIRATVLVAAAPVGV